MKRLLPILIAGAGLAALAAAWFVWHAPSSSPSLPNIIFIVADDIGHGDYHFAGHPEISTPHIDRLAQAGVVFSNGYTVNSICRPSLASLITGLYPSQHEITVNARNINTRRKSFEFGLPLYAQRMNELDTLPRQLATLGYRSLQTGKWWEEGFATGGFDEGDKIAEGIFRHVTRRNVIGREGLEPIFSFIDENKRQPFFIWYAPQMPHVPHNPPGHFLAPYAGISDDRVAKYYGMVSWFDDTIGQIVTHLEQQQLRDNTIIVYLADNGYSISSDILGDGSERGKDSPYESGIRMPIIFNWPGHWQPARRSDLASNIDIVPTLLDLLQPAHNHTLPGLSLLPALRDHAPVPRQSVAGESFVDTGKEEFDNTLAFRWLRFNEADGSHWKFIRFADGRHELYRLDHDPNEQHNLANDPAHAERGQQALSQLQHIFSENTTP